MEVRITPPRVPFAMTADGKPVEISREWYRFLFDQWRRSGGDNAASVSDLELLSNEIPSSAQAAEMAKQIADLEMMPDGFLVSQIAEIEKRISSIERSPEADSSIAQFAELEKRVTSIEGSQGADLTAQVAQLLQRIIDIEARI